jgi:hypothetical protein
MALAIDDDNRLERRHRTVFWGKLEEKESGSWRRQRDNDPRTWPVKICFLCCWG